MSETSAQYPRIIGRLYFIAIIPFFGGAIAPWVFGPTATNETSVFLLWSAAVLIFCSGGWLGYKVGVGERFVALHLLASLLICGAAVAALLAIKNQTVFAAAALLLCLHWVNLFWVQKTSQLIPTVLKQHQRFIWTLLDCHMMVLFNLVYAARAA